MDYNRNSFDRFGDDLCEHVLSYLPLSDCFVLQCVSKQWKRLIFDKQNRLDISSKQSDFVVKNLVVYNPNRDYYTINETSLKCVFRKCRFVSDLDIDDQLYLNDSIMDIISNNCQYLKGFQVSEDIDRLSDECLKRFASKFGQTLDMININCSYDCFKLLIDLMPNLRIIRLNYIKNLRRSHVYMDLNAQNLNTLFITSDNKPVLSKLVEIDLSEVCFMNGFEVLSHRYCKQIKRLTLVFDFDKIFDINHTLFNTFFTHLTRFECLVSLELDFVGYEFISDKQKCLRAIGKKCVKLIELRLDGYYGDLGDCFANNFVLLRKLELTNNFEVEDGVVNGEFGGGVECFKSCTHLTHLSLEFPNLKDDNFTEIEAYLPKLKYLRITGNGNQLTDNTLRSVAKLRQLYCLKICCDDVNNNITDNGICYLINNCMSVRCIELNMITKVTQKSLNAFIERAKRIPKIEFKFLVSFGKPNQVIVNFKDMPKNICLEIIV